MDAAREQQSNLEAQLKSTQEELHAIKSVGGVDNRKYNDLSTKYEQLKEEQTQLYRLQSSNVQKLLDLNDQLKSRDSAQQQVQAELERTRDDHLQLLETIEDLHQCVEEKNFNIRLMQDELTALQLELLKLDERNLELSKENQSLVDRWMAKMNETAAILDSELSNSRFESRGKKEVFRIQERAINQIVPCGNELAVMGKSSSIPFYSKEGQLLYKLSGDTEIGSGCYENGLFVGASSTSFTIWHLPSRKIRLNLNVQGTTSVCFLDGGRLASGHADSSIKIWDLPRGLCLKTIETNGSISNLAYNSLGLFSVSRQTGIIARWDERTFSCLAQSQPFGPHTSINCSSNDLLVSSRDSLYLLDGSNLQTIQQFSLNTRLCGCLPSFSPDEKLFALGTSDGSTLICTREGQIETSLPGGFHPVLLTAWSPSGYLYTVDSNSTIYSYK